MKAPAGAEVGLYVDLAPRRDGTSDVYAGDVIQTGTGRRYLVTAVRVQKTGARVGRQHLRAVVMDDDQPTPTNINIHRIRWYKRKRKC